LKLKIDLNWLAIPSRKEMNWWLIIAEEDLEEFGDEWLTDEEKQIARDISWLSD
jgi:hypothetical protein